MQIDEFETLQKRAQAFEKKQHVENGYTLFFNGKPYGWKKFLIEPEAEKLGAIAVGGGRVFETVSLAGDGLSDSWQSVEIKRECSRSGLERQKGSSQAIF